MTRIDATWTPSEREVAEFNTCATDEATLTSNEISGRDGWDHVIDAKLIEWGKNPQTLVDEDFEPPSSQAIAKASKVASSMRDKSLPVPTSVVPNGEGGIAFEYDEAPFFSAIEIEADGSIEFRAFEDCVLVLRRKLPRE